MADGNSTFLNFIIGVNTEGESKLDRFKKKIDNLRNSVSNSGDDMKNTFDGLRESIGTTGDEADEASSSFMRLTGQGLALLFAGRFLSQTFGGLSRRMRDLVGISDMLDAAIVSVLAPAFSAMVEPVSRIVNWFIELDEGTKMLIGGFVAAMAIIAPIIMVFGQLVAMAAAFGIGLGAVATAIGVLVGALAILYVGFQLGMRLGEMMANSIEMLGETIEHMTSMVSNIIAGDWRAAWEDFLNIINTVLETAIKNVRVLFGDRLVDLIKETAERVYDTARDVGDRIVDGVVDAIESSEEVIRNVVQAMLPPGINLKMLESGGSRAMSGAQGLASRVNDFVIDDGRVMKTHPNDVIMGTKNPDSLGGGGGDDINIRIDNPTVQDDRDIDKIVREVERVLDRRSGGRGLTR